MLTAVLVDDEYYALEGLKMELEVLGEVKVVGAYDDAQSAINNVSNLKPDIVFLDIDMPKMTGLELFDQLLELSPQTSIVFVTAYNQYAVEAFELDALDYIVKPVRRERLQKTIQRLQKKNEPQVLNKPISIDCFGHLSIKIRGKEIDISWRTKKVEELVAYLSCGEGKFISKEKIAEVLWPELDMVKSKSNFYLTYHYLKKQSQQLGINFPIESTRGKIRLKIEEVELDILKFKEKILDFDIITNDNIQCAEKALEIYKGMLLQEHYYDWSTEQGQHYEIIYRELLKNIADYYNMQNNIEKYDYYYKKLEED